MTDLTDASTPARPSWIATLLASLQYTALSVMVRIERDDAIDLMDERMRDDVGVRSRRTSWFERLAGGMR
jgi:hypothetical protein